MRRAVKYGGAVFCLLLFVALEAMTVAPALHHWVHHDASDPAHQCAVTLFLSGQVHTPNTEVAIINRLPVLISIEPARRVEFSSTDIRLLPSRGPPFSDCV